VRKRRSAEDLADERARIMEDLRSEQAGPQPWQKDTEEDIEK
jgi:hypothetical protein